MILLAAALLTTFSNEAKEQRKEALNYNYQSIDGIWNLSSGFN